jgi:hypothetical protein
LKAAERAHLRHTLADWINIEVAPDSPVVFWLLGCLFPANSCEPFGRSETAPDRLRGTSVTLHLQVADAESVWRHALDAGALPVIPLAKQFWSELYGRLKDPSGHEWTIAQMLGALTSDEVENAARAHLTAREQ